MSLQVDRIKQNKIGWNSDYVNPNSQAYRVLEDESVYAVSIIFLFIYFSQSIQELKLLLFWFQKLVAISTCLFLLQIWLFILILR